MSAEERGRFIEAKRKARDEVLRQINRLSAKRDDYIHKNHAPSTSGFDGRVRETVKKQAADIGLDYF